MRAEDAPRMMEAAMMEAASRSDRRCEGEPQEVHVPVAV
jgi:hypothetical protein